MKTNYTMEIRLSEDLARKLSVMARAEGRTPEAQFMLMLRNSLAYFERAKGKFTPDQLKNADMSCFEQVTK